MINEWVECDSAWYIHPTLGTISNGLRGWFYHKPGFTSVLDGEGPFETLEAAKKHASERAAQPVVAVDGAGPSDIESPAESDRAATELNRWADV